MDDIWDDMINAPNTKSGDDTMQLVHRYESDLLEVLEESSSGLLVYSDPTLPHTANYDEK